MTASKLGILLKKVAPTLLTIANAAGVVATAYLSSKAAVKVDKLLSSLDAPEDKLERLKVLGKGYKWALLAGTVTIACSITSNVMSSKQVASAMAAYGMLATMYKKNEYKIKQALKSEEYEKIKEFIAKDSFMEKKAAGEITENDVSDDDVSDDDILLYYEEFRDEFFTSTREKILEAEYAINRAMAQQGYVSLNTFYSFLDLPPLDIGDKIGWSYGVGADEQGYSWVDFKHHDFLLDGDTMCTQIIYPFLPTENYMR